MTAKCTFCNDTKIEPGVPGPCVWCEGEAPAAVERHTIANLRYAGGKEHDVRYVSEVHLDAALAREAEVGRLYDSLVKRSNRERDASYKREDALRNDVLCLEKGGQLIVQEMHYYRKRLTAAEQLVQKMIDCSKGQDSIATGYLSDILDSLKPAAEGEGS